MAANARREVVLVVYDGTVLLDVAGPLQVLNGAGGYRIRLASPDGQPVRTDVGVLMGVDLALPEVGASVDTLVVAGFPIRAGSSRPPATVVDQVRRIGRGARRVASVCTGALVLAETGLLDGRRATTHWAVCSELAEQFPHVVVQPDAICVRDGRVLTSAGVTAGIDLALALVAEDLGVDRARTIAKYLVVFLQRSGGQAQFDGSGTRLVTRDPVLRRVLDAIEVDPAGEHSLTAMAARAAVSERQLTRLFRREVGTTPGRHVERIRVHRAQVLLETGQAGVASVARTCGFGSAETMRRAFLRVIGITPAAYRRRFRIQEVDDTAIAGRARRR